MRISDWSSDVCSSDLLDLARQIEIARLGAAELARAGVRQRARGHQFDDAMHAGDRPHPLADFVTKPASFFRIRRPALDEDRRRLFAARRRYRKRGDVAGLEPGDRKSTRLNSSH